MTDDDSKVNHPKHYNSHPSGIECIDIVEHMSFNVGNAIKYLWRAGQKESALTDLKKAAWYINREIERKQTEYASTERLRSDGSGESQRNREQRR